jgi:low affinity Fe/Cu permease
LPSLAATLNSLDRSLSAAFDGRERLLEAARLVDQAAIEQQLKELLRRLGPDSPEVAALRRRRQSAIDVQDEIDTVDRHIHETVLDVEALAAQLQTSTIRL